MPFFKRQRQTQANQPQLQSFILEPILTPSGLVDGPDDGAPDLDLAADIVLPEESDLLTDLTIPETDEALPEGMEPLTYFAEPAIERIEYTAGIFTVGESGEVQIDFLFDGGKYQGELAIFSLEGMEKFEPGSEEFIAEAANRALSDSELGYVVISDRSEGAKFSGSLGERNDWNAGDYQGVKSFQMRAGDQFGVMLVPNGTVADVAEDPGIDGTKQPIFSLATDNPDDNLHFGQIADVTGDGNTFVLEDVQQGHQWYDQDYNDLIFQVRGATGDAPHMDDVLDANPDWRETDLGQALVEYAKPYITPDADEITDPGEVLPSPGGGLIVPQPEPPPTIEPPVEPGIPLPEPPTLPDLPIDEVEPVEPAPRESQPLIGVIDTGFSANNPDIDYDNLTLGRDWVAGDDNPLLAEGEGNEHGTHILGIIAAEQNNGVGIDGINDEAPIWVGRAIGSGRWADSLVEFVDAAKESGQPNAVANLSLDLTQIDAEGNVTTRYELTPRERAALEYARQNNVLVVVASGNDNGAMSALGQASQEFDNLITVGAAQYLDIDRAASDAFVRADYSSYGYGLDLLANGGTIDGEIISTAGDGVGKMAGSSVAAAKVTGAASQVWAANPDLSFAQVKEILKATATDLHTANWDAQTGSGLLNMAAAISLAKATKPQQHHVTTSVIPETWSGAGIFTPGERAVATEFQGKYYEWESYTIQSEDTLSDIALATMGSGSEPYFNFIAQKNGIADPNLIITGTTILVPYEVSPPDSGDPINPSPGHNGQNIINAINQVNPDQWYYRPRDITGDGWNETFCNWFVGDVLDQLDVPLPRYGPSAGAYTKPHPIYGTDTPNKPYSANALYNHLSSDSMWEEVSASDAVTRANQGQVVLASAWGTIGHIAIVRPGSSGSTVRIAQAGATNGKDMAVGTGFGSLSPSYFVYKGEVKGGVIPSDPNPSYAPPPKTGEQMQHIIKPGDTLWDLAQQYLGDGRRWVEIQKDENGTTFTAEEARHLQVNQAVYIPVKYSAGTGGYTPDPSESVPIDGMRSYEFGQFGHLDDTLWEIAERELGSGFRWREIRKADGSPYSSSEAVSISRGTVVYLPVTSPNPDTSEPVVPEPTPEPTPSFGIMTNQEFQNWGNWSEYNDNRNPFPAKGKNCTWYAHGRMMQLGYSEYALDSMLGNAGTWDNSAGRGATVTSTPQVASIAVWEANVGGAGGVGHVAVVERVNADGSIVISESNWDGKAYNTRTISPGNWWPSKFIAVPRA